MKNTSFIYLATAIIAIHTLTACEGDNDTVPAYGESNALSFVPTVEKMNQESVTRATATNNFFGAGDEITVKVTTNRSNDQGTDYSYTYGSDGIFTGGFRFNLDNTYITALTAKWPSDNERSESGIILDQRKPENHKKADRLRATSENVNIMPTGTPVPLAFRHEQSRFTFRMAGQNANGLNIQSIILELQYPLVDEDGSLTESTGSGAFRAYCNNTETAELILVPGTKIEGNAPGFTIQNGRYMIGMAEIGAAGGEIYTGGIWLKASTSVTLEAGVDYLVTLTPEGYGLAASIEVYGFGQNEGYIGIPLQMPTQKEGTSYEVNTALQLVTLSRLLAGDVKGEDAAIWKVRSYIIGKGIVITENQMKYYKLIDASLKGMFTDSTNNAVTTVKDKSGNNFYLFTE